LIRGSEMERNARTTLGSNWLPLFDTSSWRAAAAGFGLE
jgi:hypothetical protein